MIVIYKINTSLHLDQLLNIFNIHQVFVASRSLKLAFRKILSTVICLLPAGLHSQTRTMETIDDWSTSLKVISLIGIDVTVPWSLVSLSVCLSRSYIVLKRQKISTRFLFHTTAPCLSQITLKFGLIGQLLPKFCPEWLTPCWFERRRHSMANWGRMVRNSAIVTMGEHRKPPLLFRIADPLYHLSFPKWGPIPSPKCTHRTNFATRAVTWRIR